MISKHNTFVLVPIIIIFPHIWLMIGWSRLRTRIPMWSYFKTHQPCCTRYDCANEEASLSVIFLTPHSVADCICCDYPSLVSAVSSISSFVSALLLPALCLMCAPCVLTVVDFSAYGRSDSTRRPSLASLCKRRPGRGGGGAGGLGWAWRGWFAVMMTMSMASLAFCKLRCCWCLKNQWEHISCFAKSTQLICRTNCSVLTIQRLQTIQNCLTVYGLKHELILRLSLWMTSALNNPLEITNMHVQGLSWTFVKWWLEPPQAESLERVSTMKGLNYHHEPKMGIRDMTPLQRGVSLKFCTPWPAHANALRVQWQVKLLAYLDKDQHMPLQ